MPVVLPLTLNKTMRLGVFLSAPFSLPANAIIATLTPYTGATGGTAFGANMNVVASGDGSPIAAGVAPGKWVYSSTLDNSTLGNLAGVLYLAVDATSVAASQANQGTIQFTLQASPDGTKWPDDGDSLMRFDVIPVVGGKAVHRGVVV